MCTQKFACSFRAALCIITKNWKQLIYHLITEWMNKLWYVHTMGMYSVIKKMSIMPCKDMGEFKRYSSVKETSLKWLHNILFQLYDIWREANV